MRVKKVIIPAWIFLLILAFLSQLLSVEALAEELHSNHFNTWPKAMNELKSELIKHVSDSGKLSRDGFHLLKNVQDVYPIETDWFIHALDNDVSQWLQDEDGELMAKLISSAKLSIDKPRLHSQPVYKSLQETEAKNVVEQYELFLRICNFRRSYRLANINDASSEIIFTKHYNLGGSHYAYTEGQSDAQSESHFRAGSSLCIMKFKGSSVSVRTILDDPKGVIRDPDVSFDGERILFAWKKGHRNDDYHLYEINKDGKGLRQITYGEGVADYEGIYLPNGDIIFNSTRCVQTVDCFWTEVSNLYTCDSEGRYLRRLSYDQVHTNYPQVLQDGRVVYTRWDYNDRGQIFPQALFQMNPDGTSQTEFYGNNSWFPTTIMHAKGIPGVNKLVAVLSGHHTIQQGKLAYIDPTKGRQENEGVQLIAPMRDTPADKIDQYGQEGELYQNPYAINEKEFIVGYSPYEGERELHSRHYAIFWMDVDGNRELLAYDTSISCNQPVALTARNGYHQRPNMVDYSKDDGIYYIKDVYQGPGLSGVKKGSAKSIRVVALEFRAAGIGLNGSHGVAGGALSSTPPSARNASWDVKVVLGTTPVYSDGSAMFKVPDRTPVYFQVLDHKNHVIQTMRSWSTLQPGEIFSCVGCHESKNYVPPVSGHTTIAMQQGAKDLDGFYGQARGFSYLKEIQPIFDRSCVRCHDGGEAFSLSAKENIDEQAKRKWTDSYVNLTKIKGTFYDAKDKRRLVNWIPVQSEPSMLPPYYTGAAKSRLVKTLEKGHKGVKLSKEDIDKIACWIDLLVPFCGDYMEANAWTDDEIRKYVHFLDKREKYADIDRKNVQEYIKSKN